MEPKCFWIDYATNEMNGETNGHVRLNMPNVRGLSGDGNNFIFDVREH